MSTKERKPVALNSFFYKSQLPYGTF